MGAAFFEGGEMRPTIRRIFGALKRITPRNWREASAVVATVRHLVLLILLLVGSCSGAILHTDRGEEPIAPAMQDQMEALRAAPRSWPQSRARSMTTLVIVA